MVRRALWLLGCLTVYAVMIFMCAQLLVRYLEKPVVSRVEVSYEESLAFPAVTICNLNMLKHSKVAKNPSIQSLMTNMKEKDEKMRYQPLTPLNTTAAPKDDLDKKIDEQKHRQIKKLMQEAVSSKEKQIFQGAEVDTTSIMGVMLMGSLRNVPSDRLAQMGYSLDDLLVSCRWSAFKCNSGTLKDLWKHFWHWKYGNCYTLNSGVSSIGEKMPILTVDRSGPYDGLSMVIDVKQDQYNPFVDEAGIRVVLTDQQKMPFPFEEGFSVPTGFSTSVGVRRVYTRRVDPHGNNSCASSDEESLDDIYKKRYFVNYSVKTCRMSCLAAMQRDICNCSETRFPTMNCSTCSTDDQANCASLVNTKYQQHGLECAKNCPQPCLDNNFRYTVSSAQWSTKFKHQLQRRFLHRLNSGIRPLDISDNFLKVSIFYEELSLEKIIYEEAYPMENLLADFGGQLGLWIGVSVLTVAELIELFVNLFTLLLVKSRKVDTISSILS